MRADDGDRRDETERPERRRDQRQQRDQVARPDGETETSATRRRDRETAERPTSTTRRRDETIERDGRLGTRRSNDFGRDGETDLEENVDVDTLSNVEETVDTPVENYWRETTQGLEVLPIEPDMSIAPNDDDDDVALEIGVISNRSEEPQIESKEDQPLVLVKPPTLPCIFVRPCQGVEVKERSRIFYTADTFVLEDHNVTNSFVLEVPNELRTLKEGMHAELPKAIDAPFVVDISKGEGIT
ncbi:hypothetical protein Syun_009882 [Stephania yunnanensis]|uniref:Uncharacterized protein n=1 Tax=Stephania yunnanensis TaxID=152371 RepID=A0AAP0KFC9_9MAGN